MQLDLFKLEDKKEFKIIDEKHRLYIEALFEDYILGFYTDKNINENELINKIKKLFKIPHNNIKLHY